MNKRIKHLRKTLGLTQQKFADAIGIKRNTVSQSEMGRNEPIGSVLSLICREYNVNPKWLRTGEGEMFLPEPKIELEALAKRYDLSAVDEFFVERFVKLKPEERKVITDFFTNLSS